MKTIRRLHSVPILFAVCGWIVLVTNGCMVGPDYHSPCPDAPSSWAGVPETPAVQPSVPTAQPAELTQWWKQFNDPMLTTLIEDALKANLDLELTVARLRQARAALGIAVAGLWPAITALGDYQWGTSSPSRGGEVGQVHNFYQAGFDAAWELDLFGGQRRNIESAKANTQAAIEGIRDAQVSLVAEVALNYIQLRGFQQEIVIAQNNLKAQQNTAQITRQRANAGFASALDIADADANVATTDTKLHSNIH